MLQKNADMYKFDPKLRGLRTGRFDVHTNVGRSPTLTGSCRVLQKQFGPCGLPGVVCTEVVRCTRVNRRNLVNDVSCHHA